jgi:hypothetical protein
MRKQIEKFVLAVVRASLSESAEIKEPVFVYSGQGWEIALRAAGIFKVAPAFCKAVLAAASWNHKIPEAQRESIRGIFENHQKACLQADSMVRHALRALGSAQIKVLLGGGYLCGMRYGTSPRALERAELWLDRTAFPDAMRILGKEGFRVSGRFLPLYCIPIARQNCI